MQRPSVYMDTSVISALWYDGADVTRLARRLHTRERWDAERQHFRVVTSAATERELAAGQYRRQADCLRTVRRVNYVPVTNDARKLAKELIETGMIPVTKPIDALQLALSVVYEIEYLLSWNFAHLASLVVQQRLAEFCQKAGLWSPLLVSPESIPQDRFGQETRRGG